MRTTATRAAATSIHSQKGTRFHYALRRTLVPWKFDEALSELVEYCRRTKIDEAIVKVDTEEFSHGLVEAWRVKEFQKTLLEAKRRLNDAGVVYSLNPWVTQGHCDRGRRNDLIHSDFDWITGPDGKTCRAQACHLSQGWRRWIKEIWGMYAQTEPHVLWIEDDIRTFNHEPVKAGCFCKVHMARFCEAAGKTVSREELVSALTSPGPVHPWRRIWLELMGQGIVETAEIIAQTVQKISPKTNIGLMSSGVNSHAAEGRNWGALRASLQQKQASFYSRPPLWVYDENSPRELYNCFEQILHSRAALGQEGVIELTEVDNTPFSVYSKSNTFTFLQMAVSASLGCSGVTLNLYDHCGGAMNEGGIEEMLRGSKGYLDALTEAVRGGEVKGVGLVCRDKGAYFKELEAGAGILDMRPEANAWQKVLNVFGVPTQYGKADIYALSGQTPYELSEDELTEMLGKGVILDGPAAVALCRMGYEKYLGLSVKRMYAARCENEIAAEEFFDAELGGAQQCYVTANTSHIGDDPIVMADIEARGAKTVARLVDPDQRSVKESMFLYENAAGGRVAVVAQDMSKSAGTGFYNPKRKRYLQKTMQWLGRARLDFYVSGDSYLLPVHVEGVENSVVGFFNLCLDDLDNAEVCVAAKGRKIKEIAMLEADGKWQLMAGGYFSSGEYLRIKCPRVSLKLPLFMKLQWEPA